jgi:hypothetical protein
VKRLEWTGRSIRATAYGKFKKAFNTKPGGPMEARRLRMRCEEYVWKNIRILGVKNWKIVASKEKYGE